MRVAAAPSSYSGCRRSRSSGSFFATAAGLSWAAALAIHVSAAWRPRGLGAVTNTAAASTAPSKVSAPLLVRRPRQSSRASITRVLSDRTFSSSVGARRFAWPAKSLARRSQSAPNALSAAMTTLMFECPAYDFNTPTTSDTSPQRMGWSLISSLTFSAAAFFSFHSFFFAAASPFSAFDRSRHAAQSFLPSAAATSNGGFSTAGSAAAPPVAAAAVAAAPSSGSPAAAPPATGTGTASTGRSAERTRRRVSGGSAAAASRSFAFVGSSTPLRPSTARSAPRSPLSSASSDMPSSRTLASRCVTQPGTTASTSLASTAWAARTSSTSTFTAPARTFGVACAAPLSSAACTEASAPASAAPSRQSSAMS